MSSQALEKNLAFKPITTKDGLSNNVVYSIIQDKQGYMWFATDNGLNLYDGYTIKKFFHNPNTKKGLSSSVVRSLINDKDGNLWVGTKNGLNLYDRSNRDFIHFDVFDKSEVSNLEIMAMGLDKKGNIWINTLNNIICFNPKTYTYKVVYSSEQPTLMMSTQNGAYYKNDKGVLYFYSIETETSKEIVDVPELIDRYLYYGDLSNHLWVPHRFTQKINGVKTVNLPLIGRSIEPNSLIEIDKQRAWIGTNQGLYEYKDRGNSLSKISLGKSPLINQIRSFYRDNYDGVWIGTLGGVLHYDPNRKDFKHLEVEKDVDDVIMGLTYARSGIWANTFGNGVHLIANNSLKSHEIIFPEALENYIKYVWDIKEILESDLSIWMATNNGLISYNPKNSTFEVIDLPISDLDKNICFSILDTEGDFLWVSSYRAIHKINKHSRKVIKTFPLNAYMEHSGVQKIETFGNFIFIATEGEGLLVFNKQTENISITKFVSKNDTSQVFKTPIWDLHADEKTLWIGTNQGLYSLSLEEMIITPVLEDNQVIFSIIKDEEGMLWMGSERGIKLYDPIKNSSRYFTNKNGLKNSEFNRKSVIKTRSGELWFGGINGLTTFKPNDIKKDNPFEPFVHITSLKAIASDTTITYTQFEESISLPWRSNTIEISYVGLNFTNPNQNKYKYKMIGYDPDWVVNNQPIAARYVKLPVGSYKFNVTAANNDGAFNKKGRTININIEPPYWRTNTAYLIYLLSVIGLFGLFRSLKKYRLRIKEVEKEKELIAKKVERVFITLNNKSKIYLDHLVYIKSDGNYLEFITKEKVTIDRNKLKDVLAKLPPNFVRAHRSYVVNKNFIEALNSTTVFLKPNIEIPLSRTFKANLKAS